jgi:hypothetical protein
MKSMNDLKRALAEYPGRLEIFRDDDDPDFWCVGYRDEPGCETTFASGMTRIVAQVLFNSLLSMIPPREMVDLP